MGANSEQAASDYSQTLLDEIVTLKARAKVKIEALVLGIIDCVMEDRLPTLERPRIIKNSRDMRIATLKPNQTTKIKFRGRSSRTFAMQLHVMSDVYRMLQQGQTCTMRDMFYDNVNFYGKQYRLNNAVKELSVLLQVPREVMCIEVSGKGLIAGNISFTNDRGDVIKVLDSRRGIIIPPKLHELKITTNAKYILFVEKDAIFQRLLDEGVLDVLGPIILVTGKGYPDIQTRRLLSILNKFHRLKVFAMVDCDPYGIEIAAIVRWGSYMSNNPNNDEGEQFLTCDLSVPGLVWLGLLPTDVSSLSLNLNASIDHSERDRKKLVAVEERIKFQGDEQWLQEVNILQGLGRKTELEALFSTPCFATKVYLKSKLRQVDFPSS